MQIVQTSSFELLCDLEDLDWHRISEEIHAFETGVASWAHFALVGLNRVVEKVASNTVLVLVVAFAVGAGIAFAVSASCREL